MSNQWSNRVSFARRSQWLEPDEGKLSRPVLRGPGGSNPARLPGIFDLWPVNRSESIKPANCIG